MGYFVNNGKSTGLSEVNSTPQSITVPVGETWGGRSVLITPVGTEATSVVTIVLKKGGTTPVLHQAYQMPVVKGGAESIDTSILEEGDVLEVFTESVDQKVDITLSYVMGPEVV